MYVDIFISQPDNIKSNGFCFFFFFQLEIV